MNEQIAVLSCTEKKADVNLITDKPISYLCTLFINKLQFKVYYLIIKQFSG